MKASLQLRPNSLRTRICGVLETRETVLIVVIAVIVTLHHCLSLLPSIFDLDETGTVWSIRGSFGDVVNHLQNHLFPQTPLFVVLMWAWSQFAGMSEIALRIPSVAAFLGSIVGIYLLGRDLFRRPTALYAVLVLVTIRSVGFAATDSRPYALAILCLIWTYYFRQRATEKGDVLNAVIYGVGCGLCVHFSYFFAAALVADVLYVWIASRMGWISWRRSLIVSWIIALVLFIPLIPTLRALSSQTGLHIYLAHRPSFTDLRASWIPTSWFISALAGTTVASLLVGWRLKVDLPSDRSILLMISFWAFLPQTLLFLYCLVSHQNMFLERYLMSSAPGGALLGAYLLSCLRPRIWSMCIGGVLVVASFQFQDFSIWIDQGDQGWRAASKIIDRAREANPNLPVLAACGFTESSKLPLPAPQGADYSWMQSPFTAYPIRGGTVPLPLEVTAENNAYVEHEIEIASRSGHFLVVLMSATSPVSIWIKGRLAAQFDTTTLRDNFPMVLEVKKILD